MKGAGTEGRVKRSVRKRGMILPLVIVLVSLMMTLGIAFMRSAVQSKNIFQVFYRDDIARLIAQSVIDEWRAGF